MKEISIALETIGVRADVCGYFKFFIEIVRLLVGTVVALCTLKTIKYSPVVVNYFG